MGTTKAPGPLYVDEYGPGRLWIRRDHSDGSTETIAMDVTREWGTLLAAAPDLLTACEAAVDGLCAAMPHAERIRDLLAPKIEQARTAIAKAKGGAS